MRDEQRRASVSKSVATSKTSAAESETEVYVNTGLPLDYKPSEEELKRYLQKWAGLQNYVEHERSLEMIFREDVEFRKNTDLKHVIIKCSVLNDFYATNIYQIEPIARKICLIPDIDARLAAGDVELVEEIATVEGVKNRNYSFATKYCSHHNPEAFPIYDRYVADVLWFLKKQYADIFDFDSKNDLKNSYLTFKRAIESVRTHFGLENYTFKQIDQYLWQLGKDYYNPYVK